MTGFWPIRPVSGLTSEARMAIRLLCCNTFPPGSSGCTPSACASRL